MFLFSFFIFVIFFLIFYSTSPKWMHFGNSSSHVNFFLSPLTFFLIFFTFLETVFVMHYFA
jgi:hypothetical protein